MVAVPLLVVGLTIYGLGWVIWRLVSAVVAPMLDRRYERMAYVEARRDVDDAIDWFNSLR